MTQLRVTHDVAGLTRLDTELARHDAVPVAVGRSEGLLVEHLQALGHAVFPVSPRISARARERYRVAAVKDDRFDAFVLADTLRHEHQHWRALSVPSPLLAEIKALTRDRDRLLETQQAVESQLRMILEAYHPAPVRLFSSVDRQITLHFVGRSRNVRFRYAANTHLREASMWWTYNSMKEAPWAAAFREARDHRGQRYHRPLRGSAARWMRVLWTCWSTNTLYDPQHHTTAVKALNTT